MGIWSIIELIFQLFDHWIPSKILQISPIKTPLSSSQDTPEKPHTCIPNQLATDTNNKKTTQLTILIFPHDTNPTAKHSISQTIQKTYQTAHATNIVDDFLRDIKRVTDAIVFF
jgi:hypothetical protein